MKVEIAELGDVEIFCERAGSGEPLLLLHGGTGCHEDWIYAGRDEFLREYSIIAPDARGHGATNNPRGTITHRQCATDTLALLDRLGIRKCRAIGVSMGGNILLHMATMQPDRIEAMIVVSATMYFPDQARAIMRQVPLPDQASGRMGKDAEKSQAGRCADHRTVGLDTEPRGQLRRHEFHAARSVHSDGAYISCCRRSRSPLPG